MTDPKVRSYAPDSTSWSAFPEIAADRAKSPVCKSNCHSPNISKPDAKSWNPGPFPSPLLQNPAKGMGNLAYFDVKAIEAFVKTMAPPPAESAEKSQIDPAQAKEFIGMAAEHEKLAARAAVPATRVAHLEAALTNYQLAGEIGSSKKILGLMRAEYRRIDHPVGVLKVEAELAFIDGEVAKAAENFRLIEKVLKRPEIKLSAEEKAAALLEVNLKLSLTVQALGDQAAKERKWDLALSYYDEALRRTPSPLVGEKLMALLLKSGKGDLDLIRDHSGKEAHDLSEQILRLRNYNPCNTNCHSANQGPSASDIYFYSESRGFQSGLGNSPIFKWVDGQASLAFDEEPKVSDRPPVRAWNPADFDSLKLLSDEQKNRLYQLDQNLLDAKWKGEKQFSEAKAYLKWVVETSYGGSPDFESQVQMKKRLAQAYVEAGDTHAGLKVYAKILQDIETQKSTAGADKNRLALIKAEAAHEYASIHLQQGAKFQSPMEFKAAQKILEAAELELRDVDVGVAHYQDGMNAATLKETLQIQNQFLKAECLLSLAEKEEDLEAGQKILMGIVCDSSGTIKKMAADDPRKAILGRVRLRLAELYYSRKDYASTGNALVARILEDFSADRYVASHALMLKGSYQLEHGNAQGALEIFRGIQDKYPDSDAAQGIGKSGLLGKFRDASGKIRTDMDSEDLGEAIKVALDRSGDTPSSRKWGLAGAGATVGVVIALILAPEITIPVLIGAGVTGASIGAGGGLLVNRAWGVADHWGEVKDAYRTGYSSVDMDRNIKNMFMLGLDLAMLIPAGAVGKIVETGTRSAMSYSLKWAAGQGLKFAGNRAVGVIATRGIPAVANYLSAYSFLKAEQSLFYGKKYEWNSVEALLMVAMCSNFAMAHKLGYGARLSAAGKFPGKKLFPVMSGEGELIGFTTMAGKAAGWATDVTLGASVHYALVLGMDKKFGLKNHIPGFHLSGYGDFLMEQMATLGALHLGAKLTGKVTHRALDDALLKMDKKSKRWLEEAREISEQDSGGGPGFGGWGPWGLQPEYAGVHSIPPARPFKMEAPAPKGPSVMMMANHGDGHRVVVVESELTGGFGKTPPPKGSTVEVWLENLKTEKLIETLKAEAKAKGLRFELKDLDSNAVIVIELKAGNVEVTTTDIAMAKRAPSEVTLVQELPDSLHVAQKVLELSKRGIQRVKMRLPDEKIAPKEIVDSARTAMEAGIHLELNGKSDSSMARVVQEAGGAKIVVNRTNLDPTDVVLMESVEALTRSALRGNCKSLNIGKEVTINRSGKGPTEVRYNFSTQLPLGTVKGVFAEYLACEALEAAGMKGERIEDMKSYWKGALEHGLAMEANIHPRRAESAEKQAEYGPFVKDQWIKQWQTSLKAMKHYAGHAKHQEKLRNTFDLILKYSQPTAGQFLGFKYFDGRALADNAFELMRLFHAVEILPGMRADIFLDRIEAVLGERGNVQMNGAVVGMVYKTGIPKIINGGPALDARGNHKLDRAAQNEYSRLVEMKQELQKRDGKYRMTVIPEDRLQGANAGSSGYTLTPEWIIETLDVNGNATRVESFEITQAHGSKVTEAEMQKTIRKKIEQVSTHRFFAGHTGKIATVVYKFYDNGLLESRLLEMTQRIWEAETAGFSIPKKTSIRAVVLFESGSYGRSAMRKVVIEFKNGKWIASNVPNYLPDNVYPLPKAASGWK